MFPWLHPSMVHFAIGLLFAGVVFDVVALSRGSERLLFAGFWTTLLGAVATLLAVGSGLLAEDALGPHSQLGDALLQFHRIFAFATATCAVATGGARLAMRGYLRPRTRTLYLAGAFLTLAFVLLTGALGGSLVYRYGLGISPTTARAVLDAQPPEPTAPTAAPTAPPLAPAPAAEKVEAPPTAAPAPARPGRKPPQGARAATH